MPTVHLEAQLSPDDLLKAVDQMSAGELEQFAQKVSLLRARRRVSALSVSETDLLTRISEGMAPEERRRYQDLSSRRDSLNADEHDELLRLTDRSEMLQARRLEALVELARLRQVSLDSLMDDLGLRPGQYGS